MSNFDGFKGVIKYHNSGSTAIGSGEGTQDGDGTVAHRQYLLYQKSNLEKPPFYTYTGSVYFSFLTKINGHSLKNSFDDVHSKPVPYVWYNTNSWSSNGVGVHLPKKATWGASSNQGWVRGNESGYVTGSEYRRLIFHASGSAWKPIRNADNNGDGFTVGDLGILGDTADWYDTANEDVYYEILNDEKFYSA